VRVAEGPDDAELLACFRLIASGDREEFARRLKASPALATTAIHIAASRDDAETFFLTEIRHYVNAGDTALHLAAASYAKTIAMSLVKGGANVGARNRRGAEPLHYAADGAPGNDFWNPREQAWVITYLIERGADPNALDNSGVTPLHRAVRTRSAAAVRALLEHGANVRTPNKRGSTPLHLAVQNTGRSDSGAAEAKDQQREIIAVLLEHGARPTDADAHGKTVEASATSDWIRAALASG
jgi:Ankyrin repeats (3 copies)/Ankyrin repeat